MPTQEDQQAFLFPEGYWPDQVVSRGGRPGTIYAGLNAVIEGDGIVRTIAPPLDISEAYISGPYSETANLTAGDPVVSVPGGGLQGGFVAYQIIGIGGVLYLIEEVLSPTTMRVSPTPPTTLSNQTILLVPSLHHVDHQRAGMFAGSVIKYRDEALFAAGFGSVRFNGVSPDETITFSDGSFLPQVAYPNPDGTFDARPVGFTKPSTTPTLAAIAGGTKNMPPGTYSIKITKKRLGFTGYGLAGEAVEQTITAGQRFQVTLPAFDSSEGQTAWLIWATKSLPVGSAQRGPWFLLGEFTVVTPSTNNIEWRDDELTDKLVDNNFPPPKAIFVASMDDALIFGSCYGKPDSNGIATAPGPGFAVAKPDNPEGFSAKAAAFTSPAENVRGMMAAGSRLYALGANHVHIGSLTGSEKKRLAFRPKWHTGFWHQYNAVVAEGTFYGFTGNLLSRMLANDDADSQFSMRVKSELKTYVPQRVFLGHDARNGWVVVFHSNHKQVNGFWVTRAIAYNYQTGKWNCPVELSNPSFDFNITGCATVSGELYFVIQNGKCYQWDAGTGTVNGFIAPVFQDGGSALWLKTARRVQITGQFNGSISLYKDYNKAALIAGSGSPPTFTISNGSFNPQHAALWKPNFKGKSIALRIGFSMPASTPIIDAAEAKGDIRRDANF